MNPQLEKLIALQSLDSELAELKQAQSALPGQVQAATAEMEARKKEQESARQEVSDLIKKRKELEREVQVENDHMAKTKVKLPTVKTNKEYSAILHEIEAIKTRVSDIEDRELAVMEQLEEKEKTLPRYEARFKEEEAKFKEYKAKKEAEGERLEKEIGSLTCRRQEVVPAIEPEWVEKYEKVSRARGGLAVVPLKGIVCQGCHTQVLPQTMVNTKMGKEVQQCGHCLRFLYWVEEPESETAVPK
ncbi:MAG: hypothetical protein COV67_05600 [Nitrospinae bacterium CG11_big_fil_rev_8_21_14_0_20_56_8]|nr:MAG: hypothetical protein COV67_05600 [Nitrospinae bacterium CG11_big_fil_rev_8_21_14_0_20_56_8]